MNTSGPDAASDAHISAPDGLVAFVLGPAPGSSWDAPEAQQAAVYGRLGGQEIREVGGLSVVLAAARSLEAHQPRWVTWDRDASRTLIAGGVRPARAWDIAQAWRCLAPPHPADAAYARPSERRPASALAWAHAFNVPGPVPAPPRGDMLDTLTALPEGDALTLPDNHLRPDAAAGSWQTTPARLLTWARAALAVAAQQQRLAAAQHPRLLATLMAESATVVLCEELETDGLPVDRAEMARIIQPYIAPAHERDQRVWDTVPGSQGMDLRNPEQVKALLARAGIAVPNTRKHTLAPFAATHPLVAALLEWRKAERVATTYGTAWLEQHVGDDGRLRGRWQPSDGAAGRMSAEAGLHNLPAMLRPGVDAGEGWVFVRADLGQIEPRVLALVAGDEAFAAATRSDDLYAPVAQRLGAERDTAKVAVLAAMYGQRSGAAGRALDGLERAYPTAMRVLDAAFEAGRRGEPVRTWGGRLVYPLPPWELADLRVGADPQRDAARGRFARNALIQGSAAEFFKAWAATVRAGLREVGTNGVAFGAGGTLPSAGGPHGAGTLGSSSQRDSCPRIVLCLHDELLIHTPAPLADSVVEIVERSLQDAARRWTGGAPVRFIADTSVVRRWSDAH